ncbi:MAG: 30S ribosome-binding factor RbfA [Candidatus Margulisbacteria bacterium]|nr:30S ribosome-binding factor RbfA [Candidatus Margulisiibacteriota bacterium]
MTRPERVAALIKEEVSRIIHEDVSDPRIGFVSVTGVDISPDLENAKIFVSILDKEDKKKECMDGLNSATRFIRGKLGHELTTRIVPEIEFVRDDSLERGSKILGLISKLGKENHERNLNQDKESN